MEHFVVSARKYRPQTFKDVVGQQAITNTLLNAIENNHLAQGLLFTGPRGVGKTTCARILAKRINQQATEDPEEDFAFNIFELDAASNNSVDDIRNLIDQVRIPPQVGKYKVYIIDEVHMLSQAAFNAFLKTLEEPPKHAIFILATTEKHKIIPTILSRCQIFDFKRITVTDAKNYLAYIAEQEGVEAEDDALHIIAQKADGAMRDALSIYDRVVSFSGKNLTRQAVTENLNVLDYDTYLTATDLILENNIPQLFVLFNEILSHGFDGHHFIAGLASHFRDLLVCRDPRTINLLEVGENTKQKYYEQSKKTTPSFLVKGIELANSCDLEYKNSRNQRLLVELCLMQLASITFEPEKKKAESFIIPPSNFTQTQNSASSLNLINRQKEIITEKTSSIQEGESLPIINREDHKKSHVTEMATTVATEEEDKNDKPGKTQPDTIVQEQAFREEVPPSEIQKQPGETIIPVVQPAIKLEREKVSGLSLKSIRKKKELEAQQRAVDSDEQVEKSENFTESQMQEAWQEFADLQNDKGEKILVSIMETDTPVLHGKKIILELPNETMKLELEKVQYSLLGFIKDKLQNTQISLEININETIAKKYAFTPQEKYEKLREKNPLIDKLRSTFDLDI